MANAEVGVARFEDGEVGYSGRCFCLTLCSVQVDVYLLGFFGLKVSYCHHRLANG